MTGIKWGSAIAVDGKRPGFVSDGDAVLLPWEDMHVSKSGRAYGAWASGTLWKDIPSLRLPADHPHYRQTEAAIPEGMKAWHGGDDAPDDYRRGHPCRTRCGITVSAPLQQDWQHLGLSDEHSRFEVVAYTPIAAPQEAPIDWSGELEAVHEDGRVMPVTLREGHGPDANGDYVINGRIGAFNTFNAAGLHYAGLTGTHIRNVPQPTPQADTKPDLTARMEALVRRMKETNTLFYAEAINSLFEEAHAIAALLAKPVDPDLQYAHALIEAGGWAGEHQISSEVAVEMIVAARRDGRALALAGEKEA